MAKLPSDETRCGAWDKSGMNVQMTCIRQWAVWLVVAAAILTLIYGCASVTAEMGAGERLYRGKCSSCHRLIGPEEHEASTWRHYVDEYGSKLHEDEKRSILQFLADEE